MAWAGAAIQTGGSIVSNVLNLAQAYNARQFIREQRATAHQVERRDLELAGLNPILTATGGRGAGMGESPVVPMQNPAEGLAKWVLEKKMVDSDLLSKEQERKLSSAQQAREASQTELNKKEQEVARQIADKTIAENKYYSAMATAQNYENEQRKRDAEIYGSSLGKVLRVVEKVLPIANWVVPALGGAKALQTMGKISKHFEGR